MGVNLLEGYLTLVEAAELAGVAPAELRRYTKETKDDGSPRLRTVRIGTNSRAPHLTRPEWLQDCMANRKRVKRKRPTAPILRAEPGAIDNLS